MMEDLWSSYGQEVCHFMYQLKLGLRGWPRALGECESVEEAHGVDLESVLYFIEKGDDYGQEGWESYARLCRAIAL